MTKNIDLSEIKVQSFTTSIPRTLDIRGGATQNSCNVGCAYNSEHPEVCSTEGCTNNIWCGTGSPWWRAYPTDVE